MSKVVVVEGGELKERVLLGLSTLNPTLPPAGSKIVIKPNLFLPYPNDSGAVTRRELVEALIEYLGDQKYEIFIGEGAAIRDTWRCFREAGYDELEARYKIKLVDLNDGEFVEASGRYWRFQVSKILLEADYVISAAVLKEHAFEVTLTLKNMMGVLRPGRLSPVKSYMHREYDLGLPNGKGKWARRLCDLIRVRKPDLAIIDATTAMLGSHMRGRLRGLNRLIMSEDAVACDIVGADMLGHKDVFYLDLMVEEEVGRRPTKVEFVKM